METKGHFFHYNNKRPLRSSTWPTPCPILNFHHKLQTLNPKPLVKLGGVILQTLFAMKESFPRKQGDGFASELGGIMEVGTWLNVPLLFAMGFDVVWV